MLIFLVSSVYLNNSKCNCDYIVVKLEKFEIPQCLMLVTEEWTPETELVTAALKLKRKNITAYYREALDTMYGH